ncbi:hypothetical protein GWO43_16415 [candidate division KSB1 bacterium]|nr:hypothetical protein [candidate division KSB1 bacterium]NIR68717.1 hypothetical protein [candidate division KSB1 bacterium]NIS25534.1 hypothetical protein [candidate division KSB1 bacterium]NIT72427.1 hypothetical protein [candidate division KSB1 bacterium]NIU26211.1 hypothetical protein [candidate division KSB1 bacterium]
MLMELFENEVDRYGRQFSQHAGDYEFAKVSEGAFTSADKPEALVCFFTSANSANSHGEAGKSIWLLEYEETWKIAKEVAFFVDDGFRCYPNTRNNVHKQSFKLVDIENDGKNEILVIYGYQGGGGGEAHEFGQLLSLTPDSQQVLFEYEGFDYSGLSVVEPVQDVDDKGLVSICHRIRFQDVNSDGILELIDEEESEFWYRTNNEDSIFRWYEVEKVQIVITEHTYQLIGGTFKKIKSEVKHSYFK